MDTQLVQPIAVSKNKGTHEQVIHGVATASVLAWLAHPELPAWDEWLAGRFTKSVRRGTPTQMAAVSSLSLAFVRIGDVEIMAFEPMAYEDFPHHIAKMQVSGLERPEEHEWPMVLEEGAGPVVWLNNKNKMTTGKTAAQVAHGVFAWALKLSDTERDEWFDAGIPMSILPAPAEQFAEAKDRALVVIEDAGLTETDPGTVTCVVTW